jgi:hypothetical protein
VPQLRQIHSRIERYNFPILNPQQEQVLEVGSHLSMTRKSLPYFSDFASRKVLNVLQPKSEIARDNLRSLTSLSRCGVLSTAPLS